MRHGTPLRNNQSGLVSILVVMIMSIIISIVTVGFIKIMIRESRDALDNQLTTQAFYAASSGVNDARTALQIDPSLSTDAFCKNTVIGVGIFNPSRELVSSVPVDYPCQLIDKDVYSIIFQGDTSTGRTYPIETSSGHTDTISIEWESVEDASGLTLSSLPTAGYPLPSSSASGHAYLRVTVINATPNGSGQLSRADLTRNARNFIVRPTSDGSGDIVYDSSGAANDGGIYSAKCEAITATRPYQCKIALKKGSGQFDTSAGKFYIRILPIYNAAHISISGCEVPSGGSSCQPQLLKNAQYSVDSTGRSNDVYRRVSVRLNQDSNLFAPDFTIDAANICKQLEISDVLAKNACGNQVVSGPSGNPYVGFSAGTPNPLCDARCTYEKNIQGHESDYNGARTITNTSDPDAIGCTWDWGYGTPEQNVHCGSGDKFTKNFPNNDQWQTCTKVYHVVLTARYQGGVERSYSTNIRIPWWTNVDDFPNNEDVCP